MSVLELSRLSPFDAFARHLSFTRAALELHVSQPALHMQVGKLEDELGVSLYRRVGQRLELTSEGERVAELAARCVADARRLVEALTRGEPDLPVRIAAGDATHRHLLLPVLETLHRQGPPGVSLLVRDRDGALDALRRGDADLAVAPSPHAEPPADMWSRPACSVETRIAMPAGHPLSRRRNSIRPQDLDGCPLVLPPTGRPLRTATDALLSAHGVRCPITVEASGWDLLLDLVSIGLGLCPVNATIPLPAGVISRPLQGWPSVLFCVWTRPDPVRETVRAAREAVWTHLASHGTAECTCDPKRTPDSGAGTSW